MPLKDKAERKHYLKKWHHALRLKVIAVLGSKCRLCGIDDFRVLQIDHIYGGGNRERRKLTSVPFYRQLLKSGKRELRRYQLLCANCNWIKKHEEREVRS